MNKDRSYLWFVIPLLGFVAMMLIIGASMAKGAGSGVDQVPKLISRTTPADTAYIAGDTLYINQMAVTLASLLKAVAVQVDTVRGANTILAILDDTVRIDPDSSGSLITITFGGYGGGIRWNRSSDAMEFTNDFTTWTTFGSGSGTGDIEGVTAGSGLSGGGTTGTPTLDVKPGWGLYIHDDSVKVRYTDLEDSLTGGTDQDSIFRAHFSSRWRPMADSSAQYVGDPTASRIMDFSRGDTILAFIGIFYGEGIVDSMLMSKKWIEEAIGDSVSGKIDGINSQNGITGSASEGVATIEIDWPWLWNFIDTCTATIPHATLADTTNGGAIRAETTKVVLHSWIYNKIDSTSASIRRADTSYAVEHGWIYNKIDTTRARIPASDTAYSVVGSWFQRKIDTSEAVYSRIDTTTAKIPTATLADSAVKYDTANVLNWTEVRTEIKNGAEIYNKIDTTNAKIPTASLADSCVKYDTTNTLNWTEVRAEIKNGAENWNKIDTTSAKIPTASLADSCVKYDTVNVLNWTEVRTEIKTGAEIYNKIDTTSAKIPTASTADAVIINSIDSTHIKDGAVATADLRDTLVTTAKVKDYNVTKVKVAADAVDSTKIVAGSVSTADLRDTLITTAKLKNFSVTAAKVDSTATFIIGNLRTRATNQGLIQSNNIAATDPDSILKLGSAAGLIIADMVTLGSDIEDDTLVVDYYPEYEGAVLAGSLFPTYNDSIDIWGDIENNGNMGNVMYFNDSTLTSGQHRRGFQIAIKHPMRVDSLRYIIVQGLVKDSSGTNTMWLKGMLRTTTFNTTNVDSNAAGNIKDYDSLGGDYTDVAAIRQFVLTGGAITEGSPWYLLLVARHGSGTAWNWAKSGRIRAVYSRTRL